MRLTVLLVRPLARALDWGPLLAVLAAGLSTSAIVEPRTGSALLVLRMIAALTGGAAAFALVDPMDAGTRAAPVGRGRRQWIRCGLALGAATGIGGGALVVVANRVPTPLPVGGLAVEMALLTAIGLAGGAVSVRSAPGRAAALGGLFTVAAVVGASLLLPDHYTPWTGPGDARWDHVHHLLAGALAVPVLVLALANREGVRGLRRRG
ncbi:hypothetical protein [Cryptosporangium japonicum]|uniref:ABC transporter n=1 Tax=Cryptosporangium japonicum TaxID=80872 RepID=A0ABN0UKM0_9ACTN